MKGNNTDIPSVGMVAFFCILVLSGIFTTSAASASLQDFVLQKNLDRIAGRLDHGNYVRVIVGLKDPSTPVSGNFPVLLQAVRTEFQGTRLFSDLQKKLLQQLQPHLRGTPRLFRHVPYMALDVDRQLLEKIRRSPLVAFVHEDQLHAPALSGSIPQIGVDRVWKLDYSGKGTVIAIVDTGVDSIHPMLEGKVVAEACFSTTSPADSSVSLCPDGSGMQTGAGAGINCPLSIAGCFHGSHVAGIAAGNSNIEQGVARDAGLISVQVFSKFVDTPNNNAPCGSFNLPSPCSLTYASDILRGLEWLYEQRNNFNIVAINMSLGSGEYSSGSTCDNDFPEAKLIIDNLRSVNIATIVASGNAASSTAISSPACISSAISVGAVSSANEVASFSNSASFLDFLAPGVSIHSAEPGNQYGFHSGTSMATPHVAGAWAVLRSQMPDLDVDQVYHALSVTGVAITDQRNLVTTPRIQVDQSINAFVQLYPGFNLFGGGVDPGTIVTTFDLLSALGTSQQINRIERFGSVFETASYGNVGQVTGDNAAVVVGEGYFVHANEKAIVENNLDKALCGPVLLRKGYNIANVGCAQVGMSSFELLRQLGGATKVASVKSYDQRAGRFQTAAYLNGQMIGEDFPVLPSRSVIINTLAEIRVVIQ